MNTKFVSREIIPNYILDTSINYNQTILPIFLYLKRRTNKDGECFLNFQALLQYFSKDSYTKVKKEIALKGLLFILFGSTENIVGDYNNIIDSYQISSSYELDESNTILKNLCKNISIEIDELNNELIFHSNNKDISIEDILKMFLNILEKETDILLHDLTNENMKKFIQIDSEILQYLFWYYKQQNQTLEGLQKRYTIKNNKKLLELRESFNISEYHKTCTINFTTMINLYFYIYKLYVFNKNMNQKTYISSTTLSNLLKASNSTISLYINILQELKLLIIKKGSFKNKQATIYIIINKWQEEYTNLNNYTVYRFSIITKKQFEEIKSCYTKISNNQINQNIQSEFISTNSSTPIKRGRGRPRKNPVIQ